MTRLPLRRSARWALIGGLSLALPLSLALVSPPSGASALEPSSASRAARAAGCGPWMNPKLAASERADRLVATMSQAQKLHMVTWSDPPYFTYYGTAGHVSGIPELCVPDLVLSDAGSGVAGVSVGTTTFPAGVAQASTWNPRMQRAVGRAIGAEAHERGINVMLGPGMNIARTPYNGRNFEYFGEDPYLAARTGVAFIKGIQSNPVLADAKHYAFNDQEINRNTIDARVDERTRHEIYLRPFEAAVKDAKVGSLMCSYNLADGEHVCQNKDLLTDVLRTQWGFDGFVVSDWGAVHSTAPTANAGMDLEMFVGDFPAPQTPVTGASNGRYFGADDMTAAIQAGAIAQSRLDDMVRNIVRPMFREGLFDHAIEPTPATYAGTLSPSHLRVARQAAVEATVLLKNQGAILPLNHRGGRTIAVIGWAAGPIGSSSAISGGGSSHGVIPSRVVSPLEGIRELARRYGDRVVYVDGTVTADAVAAASMADLAIVVASDASTEGTDRTDLGLHPPACVALVCAAIPVDQNDMIDAVTKANPQTIVALDIGAPVKMPWLRQARAVLVPWYAGLQHGHALASVIYGNDEPGGRLPQTFPVSEKQLAKPKISYPGVDGVVRYTDKLLVGYRAFDQAREKPLFPFGFGLSYTKFSLSRLKVQQRGANASVTVRVTNTGARAGKAVPQIYVGFPRSVGEPPRQLKGYAPVRLAAGASRTVKIPLDERAFAHWDTDRDSWVVSAGTYRVFAGQSSRDLPLRTSIQMRSRVLRS